MNTGREAGIDGGLSARRLVASGQQFDDINLSFQSDAESIRFQATLDNGPENAMPMKAVADGALVDSTFSAKAKVWDGDGGLAFDLGMQAAMVGDGLRLHLTPLNPVLAYNPFEVNAGNFVRLTPDMHFAADIDLRSREGIGRIHATTEDSDLSSQDVSLVIDKLNLDKLTLKLSEHFESVPRATGIVDGTAHFVQKDSLMTITGDVNAEGLSYAGSEMGNLGMEFTYKPSDGFSEHYIEGVLRKDGEKVCSIDGSYKDIDGGTIDIDVVTTKIPLNLANGFVPDQIVGLQGTAEGDLTIKGTVDKPVINGELYLEEASLESVPYGLKWRFDDDPVLIKDSRLLLENFEMYAYNDQPLNIYGYVDFANLDNVNMNMRMRAENYQVINAKENLRSVTYGKAFVNFFGLLKGSLSDLQLRGKVDVLGSTDMTYVLRDSPLSTDNQLEGLVRFTDFNDSTQMVVHRPQPTGLDVDMTITVGNQAHVKCDLNADHSNYIDLVGGGDLRMRYNNVDGINLTGRYTLANGEMKYSLPVIPLKTFTIQDGSYVEFTGDPMNPTLNITALETTRASVSDGTNDRIVSFNVGVVITQTLNRMGLEFVIDAPEDNTVSDELKSMSKEERGKLAVTMLTTGMYLTSGNTSSFTMNSALSSFLQQEINNITGSALRTLDLSVGLDNSVDASGRFHTDYSFKFAKRFWNNRLKIIVGGKLSTGPEVEGQSKSFFDNVSMEYRLDENENKALNVYYKRSVYDWLEGELGEYGAGFVWRRKTQNFSDLWNFKKTTNTFGMPARTTAPAEGKPAEPEKNDSTQSEK